MRHQDRNGRMMKQSAGDTTEHHFPHARMAVSTAHDQVHAQIRCARQYSIPFVGMFRDDFVQARTHDGRPFRMLTVIDEFTRESLAVPVARRLRADRLSSHCLWRRKTAQRKE